MLIKGEKYACEACIRGHRVSNCQHNERPLTHINKKGRPVTQCQHCRAQRKNRSAHVKCDCGEKTTKCVHLGAKENHRESCCCNHGGKCSCGGLKSDLEPVPETPSPPAAACPPIPNYEPVPAPSTISVAPKSPTRRSRANTSRSEGTVTLDESGRHKTLTHKHAKAVTRKTLPYPTSRISVSRSASNNQLNSYLRSNSFNEDDDLDIYSNSFDNGIVDSAFAGHLSLAGTPFLTSQLSQQQARLPIDGGSPNFFGTSLPVSNQMGNALSLSTGSLGDFNNVDSLFHPYGEPVDSPLFSASTEQFHIDWNNTNVNYSHDPDMGSDGGADPLSFSHTAAYEADANMPPMVMATSGDVSEADDNNSGPLDFEQEFEADFDNHTDSASSMGFSRVNSNTLLPLSIYSAEQATSPLCADGSVLRDSKAGNQFFSLAPSSTLDDMTVFPEDDTWLSEYHGLPAMGPESPDAPIFNGA